MSDTPRVSVIMIFLDAESFIEESIQSVLDQTYSQWELLLVDDGSTDGSTELARRYADAYSGKISYLEHEGHVNCGMSASRNLGLAHARGEYIALLDSDDIYLPEKLEEQVELLDQHPMAAMLYGRTRLWFSWSDNPSEKDSLTAASRSFGKLVQPAVQLADYIRYGLHYPCTCSVVFRRTALEAVGGFEDEFRGTFEDMAIYSKIFLRFPVLPVDQCWDWYRQHPDSSWAEAVETGEYVHGEPNPVHRQLLTWIKAYMEEHEIRAPVVSRLVRLHLLPYSYPRLHRLYRAMRATKRWILSSVTPHGTESEIDTIVHAAANSSASAPKTSVWRPSTVPSALPSVPASVDRPGVSVIMVFLNGERFIDEAITSVFRQTYSDWELLLVDDGSTDASTAIARRYAEEHPERVHYLEHPGHENRGAAAARNLGLRHARGEYIAFLDADDVYLPRKLEEQVALLSSQPEAAMLYGRTRLWYSWDGRTENRRYERFTTAAPRLNALIRPPELVTAHLRDEHVYPTTCSVLIRRQAIDAVNGFEEQFRTTYEDMTLFMKILLHFPVFVADSCWDWYRKHPDSTWALAQKTGQYRPGRPYPARGRFLEWLEAYLKMNEMSKTTVGETLQKELRPYRQPKFRQALWRLQAIPQMLRGVKEAAERTAVRHLPESVRRTIRRRMLLRPPVGLVRFGSLRRVTPISEIFGYDRGTPVDRFYIENFLARHAPDIHGRVLEVEEDTYTRRFGGDRVKVADVLYVEEGNPAATIVADLQHADHIPSDSFDCIILTQTMQYIYDGRAAVNTLYRILKPGGVLLATLPGISETGDDYSGTTWHWSFTPHSVKRLFQEAFPQENVQVESHGNVLAAISFLHGITVEELRKTELEYRDPRYVVSNSVRAVKPA